MEGTEHFSRGDFSLQIDIDSQDEIGNLAKSFNEMSRQLQLLQRRMEEANKRLIQVEKLARCSRFAGDRKTTVMVSALANVGYCEAVPAPANAPERQRVDDDLVTIPR